MPDPAPIDHPPEGCRHWVLTLQAVGFTEAEARALFEKISPLLPQSDAGTKFFSMMVVEHYQPAQLNALVAAARQHAVRYVAEGAAGEMTGDGAAKVKRDADRLKNRGTN